YFCNPFTCFHHCCHTNIPLFNLSEHYPFKPLVLIPSTTYRWKMKKTINTGINDTTDMANMAPQFETDSLLKNMFKAMETVYFEGLFKYSTGPSKLLHVQ